MVWFFILVSSHKREAFDTGPCASFSIGTAKVLGDLVVVGVHLKVNTDDGPGRLLSAGSDLEHGPATGEWEILHIENVLPAIKI
jgi:hypothetical protein